MIERKKSKKEYSCQLPTPILISNSGRCLCIFDCIPPLGGQLLRVDNLRQSRISKNELKTWLEDKKNLLCKSKRENKKRNTPTYGIYVTHNLSSTAWLHHTCMYSNGQMKIRDMTTKNFAKQHLNQKCIVHLFQYKVCQNDFNSPTQWMFSGEQQHLPLENEVSLGAILVFGLLFLWFAEDGLVSADT